MSVPGTSRQLARCSDMSGVRWTAEVAGAGSIWRDRPRPDVADLRTREANG